MSETEAAKVELLECESEISNIKALLRSLGPPSAGENEDPNTLTVTWVKTEGLPETAEPKLTLQLSSPIEEAFLTEAGDSMGSKHSFRGVETGQATLTVSKHDKDISLGSSTHDLAPILKFDAMEEQNHVMKDLVVAIRPEGSAEDDEPVSTVSLRLTYLPSNKDRREELYEILNKTTQRKAMAVERLRKAAMTAARQTAPTSTSTSMTRSEPAVRSGFLNKPKQVSRLSQFYDKHLGSNSILRQVYPVAKNYVFFVGIVTFMHFKGQMLALPPPV